MNKVEGSDMDFCWHKEVLSISRYVLSAMTVSGEGIEK